MPYAPFALPRGWKVREVRWFRHRRGLWDDDGSDDELDIDLIYEPMPPRGVHFCIDRRMVESDLVARHLFNLLEHVALIPYEVRVEMRCHWDEWQNEVDKLLREAIRKAPLIVGRPT